MLVIKIIFGIVLYFGAMVSVSLAVAVGVSAGLKQYFKKEEE